MEPIINDFLRVSNSAMDQIITLCPINLIVERDDIRKEKIQKTLQYIPGVSFMASFLPAKVISLCMQNLSLDVNDMN